MKIIKFGGTSVGETHAIKQLCYILRDKKKQEDRYAIIVSAIGGITDQLVNCAQYAEKKNNKYYLILDEIEIKHLNLVRELFTINHIKSFIIRIIKYINNLEKFYDSIYTITYISKISLNKIMNFGELISSYLINEKLKESGFYSFWKDSRDLIVINDKCKNTQVNYTKSLFKIKDYLIKENASYIILPGFISSLTERETSTLGRGGSDYSTSILSFAVKTEIMEIWTDVNGIMTSHPKIISKAFPLEKISYKETINLSNFGAKIIYPPTILPSMKKNIPIIIRNTFSPLERGTLIFTAFKYKGLLISLLKIKKKIDKDLCILTIIINEIKNIPFTFGNMVSDFEKENIQFNGIGYIEKNISAIIAKKYLKKYMNNLHYLFFEKTYKNIYIFLAGLGKVGNKLIEMLNKQKEYLIEELHFKIKIIAICNSKIMYFNIKGINLYNWKDNLKLGISMTIEKFLISLYNLNLQNKIFVDNTASKDIANIYDDLLGRGIGVVTCNKISCASSYQEYKNIKNIAKYFKSPLFFETNVGAGLPIVNTLYYFIQSGDKIYFINAVLSGSLNFIFNKSKGYFTNIISEAKKRGFTESDIRIDLSGIDVIRKILILIRECVCNCSLELEDIKQISLLPKICLKAYTEKNFYKKLIFNDFFFTQLHLVAKEQKKRVRFIAKYNFGVASFGLEYIEFKHPFYQLDGKDNIILYTTERYKEQPILVKGSGAGIEVTASGVFSDLIKASICI